MNAQHPDAQLIDNLGGATAVAERLGYDVNNGGIQRVQNWKTRGIPAAVRVQHWDVFGAPQSSGSEAKGEAA